MLCPHVSRQVERRYEPVWQQGAFHPLLSPHAFEKRGGGGRVKRKGVADDQPSTDMEREDRVAASIGATIAVAFAARTYPASPHVTTAILLLRIPWRTHAPLASTLHSTHKRLPM